MFGPKSKKHEPTMPAAAVAPASFKPAPAAEANDDQSSKGGKVTMQNVIGKGTVIEGNIIAEGDLVVEGTVRGDVTTKTSLLIGPSCVIEGNILAQHAEVAGRVKGTVQALGLLVIKSSSMIDGDVLTKNLNVESGSTFNGRFTVGSVTSTEMKGAKKSEPTATESELGDARRSMSALSPGLAKV
ncbi:MAG: polymer-forming cytoskeletal protein [Planctomycetota bacterium]